MSEGLKTVTAIKSNTAMTLKDGRIVNYYWLGEEWYEKLSVLFGLGEYNIDTVRNRIRYLLDESVKLDARIRRLEIPVVCEEIKDYLRSHPNAKERDVMNHLQSTGLADSAWHAWEKLLKDGVIVGTGHGTGHPKTYCLADSGVIKI